MRIFLLSFVVYFDKCMERAHRQRLHGTEQGHLYTSAVRLLSDVGGSTVLAGYVPS